MFLPPNSPTVVCNLLVYTAVPGMRHLLSLVQCCCTTYSVLTLLYITPYRNRRLFFFFFFFLFLFCPFFSIMVEGLPGPDSPDGGGRGEGGLLPAARGGDFAALVQPPPQVTTDCDYYL